MYKFQSIFCWISSLHKFQRIFFTRTSFKVFFKISSLHKFQRFFLVAQVSKVFLKVCAWTKISFWMFCSHKFLIIFQGISLLILSLHKYQMTFGFKSTVKVCFLINFDNFWEVFEHTVLFYWESPKPCLYSKMALFMISWQIFKLLLQLSPLNSYLPYLRAFQWGNVWPYGLVRKVLNSQKAQNSFL